MFGDAVIWENRCGDSSLCPARVALGDLRFRYKRDSESTAESKGRDESRDTAANDKDASLLVHELIAC
jgi:hypothetical protein